MRIVRTVVAALALSAALSGVNAAQPETPKPVPQTGVEPYREQPVPPGTPGGPPLETDRPGTVEKLGPGLFRIGSVQVDRTKGTVTVPGHVNMHEGLVELLACGPRGKRHESVLVLDINPYDLQVGLILLGLEPGPAKLTYQGDPQTPEGDPIDLIVRLKVGDGAKEIRAEEFVFDKPKNRAMPRTHWIFTGSRIVDGQFMAGLEQSIVTTYHDPFSIVDNPLPEGGDDTVYYANPERVPAVGTPLELVFLRVRKK